MALTPRRRGALAALVMLGAGIGLTLVGWGGGPSPGARVVVLGVVGGEVLLESGERLPTPADLDLRLPLPEPDAPRGLRDAFEDGDPFRSGYISANYEVQDALYARGANVVYAYRVLTPQLVTAIASERFRVLDTTGNTLRCIGFEVLDDLDGDRQRVLVFAPRDPLPLHLRVRCPDWALISAIGDFDEELADRHGVRLQALQGSPGPTQLLIPGPPLGSGRIENPDGSTRFAWSLRGRRDRRDAFVLSGVETAHGRQLHTWTTLLFKSAGGQPLSLLDHREWVDGGVQLLELDFAGDE